MQVLVGKVREDSDGIDRICVGMSQNPIINFNDGTRVVFSWEELCEMAVNFKKTEETKEEEIGREQ